MQDKLNGYSLFVRVAKSLGHSSCVGPRGMGGEPIHDLILCLVNSSDVIIDTIIDKAFTELVAGM